MKLTWSYDFMFAGFISAKIVFVYKNEWQQQQQQPQPTAQGGGGECRDTLRAGAVFSVPGTHTILWPLVNSAQTRIHGQTYTVNALSDMYSIWV